MKKILTFLLLSFLAINLNAQQNAKQGESKKITSASEIKGTYQLLFLKAEKTDPIGITNDLIEKIESTRDDNKITYLKVNDFCRIKIFPRKDLANLSLKEEYLIVDKFEN